MKQLLFNSVLPSAGKSRSEHFILFCVALLGLVGSSYMLKNCLIHENDSLNPGNQSLVSASLIPNYQQNEQQILEVKGDLLAEMPIEFSMPSMSKGQHFMIDFGNGEKRRCTNDAFMYAYNTPGNYKVKLLSMQGQRLHMLESRNVLISPKNKYH